MREGLPSVTAMVVAAARALAPRAPDPYASVFLPKPWGEALAVLAKRDSGRKLGRALSLGLVDHVALRTATIDRALQAALEAGAAQVVVLGAGLDARAWRLDASVPFFEVDHPSTQRRKASRAAKLGGQPIFVPVDFETTRLDDALARAGHDAAVPTAWIWEGVTMYLPRPAVRDTLQQIGDRSPAGSRLVVTYLADTGVLLEPLVAAFFRAALGEPLLSRYAPEEFRRELEVAGWRAIFDGDSRSWERSFGGEPRLAGLLRAERMAIAAR